MNFRLSVPLASVFLTVLVPESARGAPIAVTDSGTPVAETCGSDTNLQFILSGCAGGGRDYSTFTVYGLNGQPARVVSTDNVTADTLVLQNALIKPKGAQPPSCNASNSSYVYCANLAFSRLFDAGPDATGSSSVTYWRSANGSLEKTTGGGATLSTFRVHGWVEDADAGVETPIGTAQSKIATSASYSFGLVPLPAFVQSLVFAPISLLHERELKGQFWFGFKQSNHQLKVQYVKVSSDGF